MTLTCAGVAVVLVLDRSDSMGGEPLEMMKSGAVAVASRLHHEDCLGVIAFGSAPVCVVRLGPVVAATAARKIRDIRREGGTELFSALDAAYQELVDVRARRRLVVLVTDGQAPNNALRELASEMTAEGVEISTIGVGADADHQLLRAIASAPGLYTRAEDPARLPAVMQRTVGAADE